MLSTRALLGSSNYMLVKRRKKQVEGKLNFEKNKCMAARNLAYGVDAINRI